MIAEPHPLRCETCSYLSKNNYPAGTGFCLKSERGYLMTEGMRVVLDTLGCASHSASSDVLDELEKRAIEMKKDSDKCYEKYHGDEALSMSVCYGQMLEWIAELRQKKEEPEIQKEVGVAFFYQESIPYPKGEYKFRMKIIDETGERTTPERRNYAEAFTDLFNIGIKEHRFFRECGDEQSKRFARGVMDDITELRQQRER